MAQIVVRYPIGYSMVDEKPVANNKIAEKICKQFDKGKSISLPNTDGWEVILSGQSEKVFVNAQTPIVEVPKPVAIDDSNYLFSTNPQDYAIKCAADERIIIYEFAFPPTEYSDGQAVYYAEVLTSYDLENLCLDEILSENDGVFAFADTGYFYMEPESTLDSVPLTSLGKRVANRKSGIHNAFNNPDEYSAVMVDIYTREEVVKHYKIPCEFT